MAGASVVDRVVSSLLTIDGPDPHVAMVDLLGYDAWPAVYALGQAAGGKRRSQFAFSDHCHCVLQARSSLAEQLATHTTRPTSLQALWRRRSTRWLEARLLSYQAFQTLTGQ